MSKNFEIKVQYRFEAARKLTQLPINHPCSQIHGHGFLLTLTLFGPLNQKLGWLRDYHEIETLVRPIIKKLDHHYLNDIPELSNPTSENICIYLYEQIKPLLSELSKVTLAETPTTECSYPF